jgi:bacterioferritin (cytochrome b1)
MKGNEKLIGTFNSLLAGKLTAINQYIVHFDRKRKEEPYE